MRAVVVFALLLTGCSGMSDAEIRHARESCEAIGGKLVVMAKLWGAVVEVRCI